MMYYDGYGMGLFGMILMILIVLGIAGLIVAVTMAVIRGLRPPVAGPDSPPPRAGAERVLSERFARGEIDTEEYEQRLRTLRGTRA